MKLPHSIVIIIITFATSSNAMHGHAVVHRRLAKQKGSAKTQRVPKCPERGALSTYQLIDPRQSGSSGVQLSPKNAPKTDNKQQQDAVPIIDVTNCSLPRFPSQYQCFARYLATLSVDQLAVEIERLVMADAAKQFMNDTGMGDKQRERKRIETMKFRALKDMTNQQQQQQYVNNFDVHQLNNILFNLDGINVFYVGRKLKDYSQLFIDVKFDEQIIIDTNDINGAKFNCFIFQQRWPILEFPIFGFLLRYNGHPDFERVEFNVFLQNFDGGYITIILNDEWKQMYLGQIDRFRTCVSLNQHCMKYIQTLRLMLIKRFVYNADIFMDHEFTEIRAGIDVPSSMVDSGDNSPERKRELIRAFIRQRAGDMSRRQIAGELAYRATFGPHGILSDANK